MQKWVIAGFVVLVAAALVFAVTRESANRSADVDTVQVSSVEITGSPLPRFQTTQQDPATGTPAPGIRASTFDDIEVVVRPGDDRAKIIAFFTHWCPHCQRELPRLRAWLAENDLPAGVDLIAVSTAVDSSRPNHPPSAWFEAEDWPLTALRDSSTNDIADSYGLTSFPYMVVIDGQGAVARRVSGELTTGQWEDLLAVASTVSSQPINGKAALPSFLSSSNHDAQDTACQS